LISETDSHPQVVDCLIEHCYMGDCQFDQVGRPFIHSPIQSSTKTSMSICVVIAETLHASFLKRTIHEKLTDTRLVKLILPAGELASLVNKIFHAGDSEIREVRERQVANIITASVILHEQESWNNYDSDRFWECVSVLAMYIGDYKEAEAETMDLWNVSIESELPLRLKSTSQ
jgi:hypothetical protein